MPKGENIYKRKDGRWEARYVKNYTPAGRIRYGYCYGKSYKEVKEKVAQQKVLLQNDPMKPYGETSGPFSKYCDEWLQNVKNRIKESTYIKYRSIVERYLKTQLGDKTADRIDTACIREFRDQLLHTRKLSAKTVKDIMVVLRSVLRYAQKHYPLYFREVDMEYPKEEAKEMQILALDEQKKLVDYLLQEVDPCKFGILLAMVTGVRLGELCALQWKHLDPEAQTIYVAATMQRLQKENPDDSGRTRILVDAPKSRKSVRYIPMPDFIMPLCRKMQCKEPEAYLLTGTVKYMEPRTLQYKFQQYVEDCSLEGVTFHTLRHTFATRCVEAGFEIKSLSEILGHATVSITMERYVHASLYWKRENMKKLDMIFGR